MARVLAFALALWTAEVAAQSPPMAGVPLVIGFDALPLIAGKAGIKDPAGRFAIVASSKRGPFLYVEAPLAGIEPMEGKYLAIRPGTRDSYNVTSIRFSDALRSGNVSFDYWVQVPGGHAAEVGCVLSNGSVESRWTGSSFRMGHFGCKAPEGASIREIRLRTTFRGGVLRVDNIVLWMDRALAGP